MANRDSDDLSNIGQYLSGTVGIIIAFLGFVALIVTLVLQQKQINSNERSQKLQSFENNFFHLLDLYQNVITGLTYTRHGSPLRNNPDQYFNSKEVFQQLNYNLRQHLIYSDNRWKKYLEEFSSKEKTQEESDFIFFIEHSQNQSNLYIFKIYMDFFRKNEHLLAHYFRTLYHILKYIDNNLKLFSDAKNIVPVELKFYSNILRAQLSTFEITFLFYNCLSENGREKFLPLCIKYDFFEHINQNELFKKELYDLLSSNINETLYNKDYDRLASLWEKDFSHLLK